MPASPAETAERRVGRTNTAWIWAFAALTGLLLFPYGQRLLGVWLSDEEGVAASIVAMVSGLVIAHRLSRASLPARDGRHGALGLLALTLALTLYALGEAINSRTAALTGGAATVAAIVWVTQGLARTRHLTYPLLLVGLATPIPPTFATFIQGHLVSLATSICHLMLDLIIGPVTRSGAHLSFPNGRSVWIIDDCSGLEGITMLIPAAVILIWAYRPRTLLGWATALVSPLLFGLAGNLVRVMVAATFEHSGSALVRDGLGHELLGLTTIGGSFALQWLSIRAFRDRT